MELIIPSSESNSTSSILPTSFAFASKANMPNNCLIFILLPQLLFL